MNRLTRGLVLREVNYKDSHKILTVLTEDGGKQTVGAYHCRRKNSPLAAAAQLLVWSEMTLFTHRGRISLLEASPLQEFRGLRKQLEKFALGSYFAETINVLAPENLESPELLSLLLNALYALDRWDRPTALIKAAYELKLSCLAGYEPFLRACAVCGREPVQPCLDLEAGVLHCAKCRTGQENLSLALGGPVLAAMRHILYGPPKKLFSFRLAPTTLEQFAEVCERFFLFHLDRGFSTLDYFHNLSHDLQPRTN